MIFDNHLGVCGHHVELEELPFQSSFPLFQSTQTIFRFVHQEECRQASINNMNIFLFLKSFALHQTEIVFPPKTKHLIEYQVDYTLCFCTISSFGQIASFYKWMVTSLCYSFNAAMPNTVFSTVGSHLCSQLFMKNSGCLIPEVRNHFT